MPHDLWHRLINRAEKKIDILAYAGLFLVEQEPKLVEALKQKAAAGVEIRILLGDPESPAVLRRSVEEGTPGVMAAKIHNVMRY